MYIAKKKTDSMDTENYWLSVQKREVRRGKVGVGIDYYV